MDPIPLPHFTDISLLHRALTHRSYVNEHPEALEDNERLEFLGDAVLDFLSGSFVYRHYPDMSEGALTRLRSALVRTEQLAAFGMAMGIGKHMRLGRGEEEAGGRRRQTLVCATFEALLGAYYLDSGIDAVRSFVEPLLQRAAANILRQQTDKDPKSRLQEWAQDETGQTPQYRMASVTGPDHNREFTVEVLIGDEVYGEGTGSSKQAAEQAAAADALSRLGLP